MNIYKELNELLEMNKVDFDFLILRTSNSLNAKEDIQFENIHFTTNEIDTGKMKIIYASRAVNEQLKGSGVRTHIQASVYYVFNDEGKLLIDDNSLTEANNIVRSELDKKYE